MDFIQFFLPRKSRHCIVCCGRFPAVTSPVCNSTLCICANCYEQIKIYKTPSAFDGGKYMRSLLAAYPYQGALKDAFIQYKFASQRAYHTIFAELLHRCLRYFDAVPSFDLVVPVPLSRQRLNERGFNQSALIAEKLADSFHIEYSRNALHRVRHTERQSTLNMSARTNNVKNAFLADRRVVAGRSILLVDDIFTIGATMSECAKTLLACDALSVIGITLFKSIMPQDRSERYDFDRLSPKNEEKFIRILQE